MSEALPSNLRSPQVGDIWREVDPRRERYVKITRVDEDSVRLYSVEPNGGLWTAAPRSREGWAKMDRFNGKRGGYTYFQRVGEPYAA